MSDLIFHYTNTQNGFSLLEPEEKNSIKYLQNEICSVIKHAGIKPKIENDDILRKELLAIYSQNKINVPIINIWTTDISKLNDKTEMENGIELIKKFLDQFLDEKQQFEDMLNILNDEASRKIMKDNSYTVSFSESEDDLNQWRLYSDNGQGISIGVDKLFIKNIARQTTFLNSFNIAYDEDDYEKMFNELFHYFLSIGNDWDNKFKDRHPQLIITQELINKFPIIKKISLLRILFSFAMSYKNKCFLSENEFRIYINPIFAELNSLLKNDDLSILEFINRYIDQGKNFRATPTEIIKYKILPIPISCIKRIYLGPKNNTEKNILEDLLAMWGYNDIVVKKSEWSGIYK